MFRKILNFIMFWKNRDVYTYIHKNKRYKSNKKAVKEIQKLNEEKYNIGLFQIEIQKPRVKPSVTDIFYDKNPNLNTNDDFQPKTFSWIVK